MNKHPMNILEKPTNLPICVVVGASHAGVNFAFSLRREGWEGSIILIDSDPHLPYHRPPLSKDFLTEDSEIETYELRSEDSYKNENIELCLGIKVTQLDRNNKQVILSDGSTQKYDYLVLATGVRPYIPPIEGLENAHNLHVIRSARDAITIRQKVKSLEHKSIVIIGGGYIGLETAASLQKMGCKVTILEREERILSRVTTPFISKFISDTHETNGVTIYCNKTVVSVQKIYNANLIICSDNSLYKSDILIVGAGVIVNSEIAVDAELEIENGIKVDANSQTNDKNIYAIGDCTYHYNPHYNRHIRLECVQNAVDQAKVAAAAICNRPSAYNSIPWFWSDQYDLKLQMVGLTQGYTEYIVRTENENSLSVWYFNDDELLAVDAINYPKAYVLGMKFIKSKARLDKVKLGSIDTPFKPAELLS